MKCPTFFKQLFLLTLVLFFISCSSDNNTIGEEDAMENPTDGMDEDSSDGDMDGDMVDDHDHGDNDDSQGSDDTPTSPVDDTGGVLYVKDESNQVVVEGFDLAIDRIELGPASIHNQIPIDTDEGVKFDNLYNENYLLIKDIFMHQLATDNFYPIADAHLQQDLSACMAWENGNALVRPNTIYVRSHEENQVEFVDFNPNTDKINFMYLSVRGDDELNFSTEQTSDGVRFFSPITGQSITLKGTTYDDFENEHFEWRANQLEDNIASRMGLAQKLNGFQVINENVYSGKSIANAGGVDKAPYHVYNHDKYTGTPRKDESGFEN